MLTWLRSRFARTTEARPSPPAERERPPWLDELLENQAELVTTLQSELLDAVQKQTRAAAKQAARTETALSELEAGLTKLPAQVAAVQELHRLDPRAGTPRSSDSLHDNHEELEDLFDALDALDQARELAREPHLASGLERVGQRLLRFCERAGCTRVAPRGELPDARLVRVVGTELSDEIGQGRVARVVRAAIVAGSRLVREGQVIVAAGPTAGAGSEQAI